MSYGRRLALFFLLIVLVPMLALVGLLVFVSDDSRSGKADARLAAGVETAATIYSERVAEARAEARKLARDPGLAPALDSGDREGLTAVTRDAIAVDGAAAVELTDEGGSEVVTAGSDDAIAFADARLVRNGEPVGTLRVSTTTAEAFAAEVRRLTNSELVVSRDGRTLAATVTPPESPPQPGETADLELADGDFRAHQQTLDPDDGETMLLLGPRKEGGLLAIGPAAAALLIGFLLLAGVFAYVLARTLTRLHGQLADQAATDSLTGLWNRGRMSETLAREVDRALRFAHPLSFLILDADDFKSINDAHGHLQGDAVLQTIAAAVKRETRTIDLAARYGGDEFALILIETDADGAAVLAERLCNRVRATEIPVRGGGSMGITISAGVASVPGTATDADSLIDAADKALLEAKRAGKDQIRSAPRARFEASRRPPQGAGWRS